MWAHRELAEHDGKHGERGTWDVEREGMLDWVILPPNVHAYSCTAEMVQLDDAHGPACMRLTIGNRPNSAQSHENCVEVVRLRI